MFDTIGLSQPIPWPDEQQLVAEFDARREYDRSTRSLVALRFPNEMPGSPRISIVRRFRYWYLLVEVSYGSWLAGTNTVLPKTQDVPAFFEMLEREVLRRTGIEFKSGDANVIRVDFTRDLQLSPEHVIDTIRRMSQRQPSRYLRDSIDDTSVMFRPRSSDKRSSEFKAYSKYHERLLNKRDPDPDRAFGILRMEASFKNGNSVARVASRNGLPSRKASGLLKQEISDIEIDRFLRILKPFDLPTGDNVSKVVEQFKGIRAATLIGFLDLYQRFGPHFYKIPRLGYKRNTYYDHYRLLACAGIL